MPDFDGGYGYRPVDVPRAFKYGGFTKNNKGLFTEKSFAHLPISPLLLQVIIAAVNNGLAASTWQGYKGVRKHLKKCAIWSGLNMSFPMNEGQVLVFVAYLWEIRNLKAKTISNYLSAVRMLHLVNGNPIPCLRPTSVQLLLRGLGNHDGEEAKLKPSRQAVTLEVLELLYVLLKRDRSRSKKQRTMIWSLASLCFWGGFRYLHSFPVNNN